MADKPPAGKKKGGLTRKVGPLPLWAWTLVAAIAGYFVWTKFLSGSASGGAQAVGGQPTPASTPADTSGLGGSTGGSDTTGSGQQNIADALGAQTTALGGLIQQSNQALLTQFEQDLASFVGGPGGASAGTGGGGAGGPGSTAGQGTTTGTTLNSLYHPISIHTANFGQAARAQTVALRSQGSPLPFGGVASVHVNKATGVTTTTYASGRVVTQAKGHTAYVSHR